MQNFIALASLVHSQPMNFQAHSHIIPCAEYVMSIASNMFIFRSPLVTSENKTSISSSHQQAVSNTCRSFRAAPSMCAFCNGSISK